MRKSMWKAREDEHSWQRGHKIQRLIIKYKCFIHESLHRSKLADENGSTVADS